MIYSGAFFGAVLLTSSFIIVAACVGLLILAGGDGESVCFQACLSGEGLAGVVGLRPVVRSRDVEAGAVVEFASFCGDGEEGDGERADAEA